MWRAITSQVERMHEQVDPSYRVRKEEGKNTVRSIGLISVSTLVASVALVILGIALTASSGLGAIVGVPLIFVSLPLGYLSFNAYQVSKNMIDIVDNPNQYRSIIDPDSTSGIRDQLKKKTFCFSWAIDFMPESWLERTFPRNSVLL